LVLVLTFAIATDIAIRLGFFESASKGVDGAQFISAAAGDSANLELRTLDSPRLDERSSDSGRVRFNHISIVVTDLDRSIEFYKNQLGFDLLSRQRSKGSSWELAFLAAGDGEPVLELQQYTRGDGKAPTGFSHLGVFVCDVNSFYDTSPVPRGTWQEDAFETQIAQMRFMTDPDGYRVEVMGYLKSKGADLELAVGSNEHCEERLFFHKVDD
jgi:catechol 2,3-dioxygenase-like lactoylglutathione lyase family enzyme|tara:strand:- start:1605 stop:2243 length:639 start_codon:yes stop_codon:yes gene_type:complete